VKRLSLPEAIGMSVSVICPTVTAAFNITLVVQAAGAAAPLAFAIGTIAMILVALSFMAFTHRVAHAGSAYAYISHTFGNRLGFIAGWSLLLTYLGFATGQAALVGSFTAAALKGLSIDIGAAWLGVGGGAMLLAWWLAFRDMRLAGRLMLGMEAAAMTGILVLCVSILMQVRPGMLETAASFEPSATFNGWSGLGFAMVFCILSFGGSRAPLPWARRRAIRGETFPSPCCLPSSPPDCSLRLLPIVKWSGSARTASRRWASPRPRSMIWRCVTHRLVWPSHSTWPPPSVAFPECWGPWRQRDGCCSPWGAVVSRLPWVACTARQLGELNIHNRYLHPGIMDYAERLLATLPTDLSNITFTCTGSESNDLALRLAAHVTGARGVIVTESAYHGNTAAVMQVSSLFTPEDKRGPNVRTVPVMDPYRERAGRSDEELATVYAADVKRAIDSFKAAGIGFAGLLFCTAFSSEGLPTVPAGFMALSGQTVPARVRWSMSYPGFTRRHRGKSCCAANPW